MNAQPSLTIAVLAEVVCSVRILLGFKTRLATIPLVVTMLVAVFFIHSGDPFAKQELGLNYLLVYIVLLLAGSGNYSIDHVLMTKYAAGDKFREIIHVHLSGKDLGQLDCMSRIQAEQSRPPKNK